MVSLMPWYYFVVSTLGASLYAGGAQVWGEAVSKLVALGDELMASDTEPLNPGNRLSH